MSGGVTIYSNFKIEWEQFENLAANYPIASKKGEKEGKKTMPLISFRKGSLDCSNLPENSILFANWPFAAWFSYWYKSLNFEAKINCNTSRQNVAEQNMWNCYKNTVWWLVTGM